MILRLWKQEKSSQTIASTVGVGKSTVSDFLTKYRSGYLLKDKHRSGPKHMSKVVKDWLALNRIQVLKWPAQSLNPIENLWKELVHQVGSRNHSNRTNLSTGRMGKKYHMTS